MEKNKKIIIALVVLISFLYIVFSVGDLVSHVNADTCSVDVGTCPHEEELNFLVSAIPIIVSIAIIVGAFIYYLMAEKVEVKQKGLVNNTGVLLKFLSNDEKKLVSLLMESNGKVLQAEVTRLPGMSKLKSHRVVQKLLDKEVIEKEKIGKTNIIKFTKEIKEGLL